MKFDIVIILLLIFQATLEQRNDTVTSGLAVRRARDRNSDSIAFSYRFSWLQGLDSNSLMTHMPVSLDIVSP